MRAGRHPFIDLTSQMVTFWGCMQKLHSSAGLQLWVLKIAGSAVEQLFYYTPVMDDGGCLEETDLLGQGLACFPQEGLFI